MVFIREHLTPRYSEIAKPLRDAMLEMQQKRAASPRKSKAKYLPKPKPTDPGAPWPSFWSQECEDAFLALKRAAVHAVELQVPDFEGSHDKTDVFHLWPDACKYGVGAGLFQGSRPDKTDPELLSAYEILGLYNWCTKGEIERRYQQIKRKLSSRVGTQSDLAQAFDAYSKLSDVDARMDYDASLGLAQKRRSRVDMRPLGFFSKSLTKAQQNWPTWERELLAVLLALVHFRSIVAGAHVEIHTDHLNNTVLSQALSNPDKILRMLLKIDSLVHPNWTFAPGRGQFGDGLSRNPPDRDVVRDAVESHIGAPKTLAEAFQVVAKSTLDGAELIDDCETYTQARMESAAGANTFSHDLPTQSDRKEAPNEDPTVGTRGYRPVPTVGGSPGGAKRVPKGAQEAPDEAQGGPKASPRCPGEVQGGPKTTSKWPNGAPDGQNVSNCCPAAVISRESSGPWAPTVTDPTSKLSDGKGGDSSSEPWAQTSDGCSISDPLQKYFTPEPIAFIGVVQRPSSVGAPRPCLLIPSFVEEIEELDKFDKFRVVGKTVVLEVCHVLPSTVVTPRLSRRWLEPYSPPPRNKQVICRFRLTVLDGLLAVCRRMRDGYLTDCIALGEGCWVTAAMLSGDLRQAAYRERLVAESERLELESAVEELAHVILVTPLTFPSKSYLPLLREYVPEIVCIIPPSKCSVLVVIPSHDVNSSVGLECSRWILGSVVETIKLPGPAYRTPPSSPLALYQLHAPGVQVITGGENKPPTLCAEGWAGGAGISRQLARVGFTVRAYESAPGGTVN